MRAISLLFLSLAFIQESCWCSGVFHGDHGGTGRSIDTFFAFINSNVLFSIQFQDTMITKFDVKKIGLGL